MPCQNVQTSQNNFRSFHQPPRNTVQMQTSPCPVCSRNTQGTCVHESTGHFNPFNPYVSNPQPPPANPYASSQQPPAVNPYAFSQQAPPCQPIFHTPCNIPAELHPQPNQGSLPRSVLEQIRACVSNAAPIFILPGGCHQQPPTIPSTQQPPATSPSMGYSVNFQQPTQQPLCCPPSFLPYPFPLPVYENHRSSCVDRSQNCGCCRRRDLERLDLKPRPNCCHGAQVDEHRCTETTDDTVCTQRNCPSAINLQALASQFLSMQGVIPCAATRLVLRKVPGSNVTSTMEETMDRAQKSISVLTKDQLLVESRSAQQVNALICLHMTANPPPNIVPILTLVQLKVNLLKAQVESLINRKLMESQGYGIEVETTGPIDPTVLALKTDGELRQLLSALRQKECDERVNLNFSPYHSQRVIAESRLRTVQNKINQVEAEFDRRRCTVLPAPAMSDRVAQQFSTARPCQEFPAQWLFVDLPPRQTESPDPFSSRTQNPRRLNLKPHVGSPETTYDRPETREDRGSRPTGEDSKEAASKGEDSSTENCTCRGWSTSEESLTEEKKKLRGRIEGGREVAMSGRDDPRRESPERISGSLCIENLDSEEVEGMEATRDVDSGGGVGRRDGMRDEEETARDNSYSIIENCTCRDSQTSGSRFPKGRRELRLRIDRCGNLTMCGGNKTKCIPLKKLPTTIRIPTHDKATRIDERDETSKKLTFANADHSQEAIVDTADAKITRDILRSETLKGEETAPMIDQTELNKEPGGSVIVNGEAENCDELVAREIDEARVKIAVDEDPGETKGAAESVEMENTELQGNVSEFEAPRGGERSTEDDVEARTSMQKREETSDIVQLVNGDDVKIGRHYGAPSSGEMEGNKGPRKIAESEGEFSASAGSSQQAESRSGLFTSYLHIELKPRDKKAPVKENPRRENNEASVESAMDRKNDSHEERSKMKENIVSMMTDIVYDKPFDIYGKWPDGKRETLLDSRAVYFKDDTTLITKPSRRLNVKREIRRGSKFLLDISEEPSFSARSVADDLRVSDSHKPGTEGNANEVKRLADMKVDADQNTIGGAAIETAENLLGGEKPITSPSRSGRDRKTSRGGNEGAEDRLLSAIYSVIGDRIALLGSLMSKVATLRHVLPILRFPMPSRIKSFESFRVDEVTSYSKNRALRTSRSINPNEKDQCQKLSTNKIDLQSDDIHKIVGNDAPRISVSDIRVRVHKVRRLIVINRRNRKKLMLIGGSIDEQRRKLLKHGLKEPYKIRKSLWLRSSLKKSQNCEDGEPTPFTILKESRKETENMYAPMVVKKNPLESAKQCSLRASKKFWILPATKEKLV